MTAQILRERIQNRYSPRSLQEQQSAIKEIYQEIALSALARAGFFKLAAFQGGTCLRIVHGLNRFSEDLDFMLLRSDRTWDWTPYLKALKTEFAIYDIDLDVVSLGKADKAIRTAVLKDDSFVRVFELAPHMSRADKQKIQIKFELDTNPPGHSSFDTHYLDFPLPFSVVSQDRSSLFASKCHALLCRPFVKGRDWYDFLWYVGNRTFINFEHLKAALIQTSHWSLSLDTVLTKQILVSMLKIKIDAIDWHAAAEDVRPLLKPIDQESLSEWGSALFHGYADRLKHYLKGPLKQAVIFRIAMGPAPKMDDRLFSGAIFDFDDDEIARINQSGTFWCQPIENIESMEDSNLYKVIFLHLDSPGNAKQMSAQAKWGTMPMMPYEHGQVYELPGGFIKHWNRRKLVHTAGIYRALYWFQPIDQSWMVP